MLRQVLVLLLLWAAVLLCVAQADQLEAGAGGFEQQGVSSASAAESDALQEGLSAISVLSIGIVNQVRSAKVQRSCLVWAERRRNAGAHPASACVLLARVPCRSPFTLRCAVLPTAHEHVGGQMPAEASYSDKQTGPTGRHALCGPHREEKHRTVLNHAHTSCYPAGLRWLRAFGVTAARCEHECVHPGESPVRTACYTHTHTDFQPAYQE